MSINIRSKGILVFEYNNYELEDKGEACFVCAVKMAMQYTPDQITITISDSSRQDSICDICRNFIS